MESTRQRKFSSLIQKELAYVFQREYAHLFPNKLVSVTTVRMSPDLGSAKVYISAIGGGSEVVDILRHETKSIRYSLAKRIRNQVRVIPEINFFYDDNVEYAENIEKILLDLDIPKKSKEEDLDDDED